ncbi:MAG: diguanylate cyclase [Acidobacteria bacterium]|nr:diguanylate cyclase [Acidobacteriota bacterium]
MKILVADDSNVSRHLLSSMVKKWGYDVVSASDGTQAWEVLRQPDAPRLAVLDWMMPGLTGPQVCEMVRQKGGDAYIYILLLTGRTQREDVIEGMTAGADDYVVKPFDQQELKVRLRAGRRIVELQDELLSAREALLKQATHDALTGLKNRARIREILADQMKTAQQAGSPLGVIMLDLDKFKQVNDVHGHAAGDLVLIAASQRVQNVLDESDAVGRYGGEEFLIVAPKAPDDLAALAERARAAIAAEPVPSGAALLTVTASLGYASYCPKVDAETLLRAADEALYRAKHQGRNRVEPGVLDGCTPP